MRYTAEYWKKHNHKLEMTRENYGKRWDIGWEIGEIKGYGMGNIYVYLIWVYPYISLV